MQGNHKRLHTAFLMYQDNDNLKETVVRYLERFDPIHLKYSVEPSRIIDDEKIYKPPMPTSVRRETTLYESTFRYGELNKETYSSIRKNLMLVYGSSHVVKNDIHLFDLTEKKIIRDFLAIPQLEKMFDEDYFNFEWDMHVGLNFTEHRNDYQRDHFIHEIRDMYSMLILLDEYGFFDTSFEILRDKDASKISLFAYRKLTNFLMNKSGNYSLLERIRPKLMNALADDESVSNEVKKRGSSIEEYATTYFFKYVIYASSMMAALFHDMGYPICHFLNVRDRISEYNPTMYMFTNNAVESFDHIASLLRSSLLFTIISPDEIKEAMQRHDGKYNHGSYSAVAFLLQFYNSGIIFSLPEEKQCAIEIAAVAIYNHTVSFRIAKEKSTEKFYQPDFQQNPIAFLLRLCDDLQEWGRRYFEFSHQSDVPFCGYCLTPSVSHSDDKNGVVRYSCLCSERKNPYKPFNSSRRPQFLNRKLYLVTTSEYMVSDIIEVKGSQEDNTQPKALRFQINYDYYKLLNITRINPFYAKFRLSELNSLKKLIKKQRFSDYPKMGFDYIYLDYFMTANPLTIKIKILQEFLGKKLNLYTVEEINNWQYRTFLSSYTFKTSSGETKLSSELKSLLENGVLDFYIQLLIRAMTVHENIKSVTDKIILLKKINLAKSDYYQKIMRVLVFETLEQYAKETCVKNNNGVLEIESFIDSDPYYQEYAPRKDDSIFYQCVAAYCNAENDFNSYRHFDKDGNNQYVNYFADLAFFEAMNKEIQDIKLKELCERNDGSEKDDKKA